MGSKLAFLSEKDIQKLRQLAETVQTVGGYNVSNTGGRITIARPRQPDEHLPRPVNIIFARLGTATKDGSNRRWSYAFTEVIKATAGHGGWSDKNAGITGTCYNMNEDQNGSSGTYGNGVAHGDLVGTFDLQPFPSGTRVPLFRVVCADDTVEWQFSMPNGVTGDCP